MNLLTKTYLFSIFVPLVVVPFMKPDKPEVKKEVFVVQAPVEVPVEVPAEVPAEVPVEVPAEPKDIREIAKDRVTNEFGPDQWDSFDLLIQKESSWIVGNVNPFSGACGLGQAWPCSKLGDAYGDPVKELDWTINYIKERYKNPSVALGFHLRHNWY